MKFKIVINSSFVAVFLQKLFSREFAKEALVSNLFRLMEVKTGVKQQESKELLKTP